MLQYLTNPESDNLSARACAENAILRRFVEVMEAMMVSVTCTGCIAYNSSSRSSRQWDSVRPSAAVEFVLS